jgi:hypothetical protein
MQYSSILLAMQHCFIIIILSLSKYNVLTIFTVLQYNKLVIARINSCNIIFCLEQYSPISYYYCLFLGSGSIYWCCLNTLNCLIFYNAVHSIDCIRLVVLKTEEENLNNRNDKILQNNKCLPTNVIISRKIINIFT